MRVLHALVAALCIVLPNASQAFHFPWDQGHDTTDWDDPSNPGPCEGANCDPCEGNSAGSPVYVTTGHLVWTDTDVSIPGRPGLTLSRTYNSHDPRSGPFGNGWTSTCDLALVRARSAEGTQFVLRSSNGKRYRFNAGADGSVVAPPGRFERIEPIANAGLRLRDTAGGAQEFNASGRLVRRIDPFGVALDYDYDASGRLTRMRDAGGRFLAFTYNSNGRVSAIDDHSARRWQYAYDAAGNLTSVTDPQGGVRRYEYSSAVVAGDGFTYQHLTRIVDASGIVVTQVTYQGERVASYTVGSNTFTYTYNTTARTATKRDSLGSEYRYVYNAAGLIAELRDPLGAVQRYEYDANGKLTRYIDELSNTWTATFDALGRKLTQTDPGSGVTRWTYDGESPQPSAVSTPANRSVQLQYTPSGQLSQLTGPSGAMTSLRWDARGNLTGATNAVGDSTSVQVDASGLPLSATDELGRTARFTYNTFGLIASIRNAAGDAYQFEYDRLGRPSRVTDPGAKAVTYSYDALGRVTQMVAPGNQATTYTYDTFGRLASRTDAAGRRYQYAYRADNLLERVTRPDGSTTTYGYDAAKRLTSVTAGSDTRNYQYNARGELIRATNTAGTTEFAYDWAGRITQETSNGVAVTSIYNAEGERTRLSALGQSIDFTRDSDGHITRMDAQDGSYQFEYDALGRRDRMVLPNGHVVDYIYDAAGQLASLSHSGPFSASYQYQYDDRGLMVRWSGGGVDWNYQYSADGALNSAVNAAQTFAYAADARGNLMDAGRVYDAVNRLTQDATYDYSYDSRGNLTQRTERASGARTVYLWNGFNQLTGVQRFAAAGATSPDSVVTYQYGPLGQRWSRTVDGVTERYVYDGEDRIATLAASGAVQESVTYGPRIDEPLSLTRGSSASYLHADHLGSIVAVTQGGAVAQSYSYDPYGAQLAPAAGDTNPFRYTAREFDAPDLYYYRARYYDPTIQRFLSEDPIGFTGGDLNLYRYAGNNPTNFTDPSGKLVWFIPVVWGAVELGLAIYDAYDTASTILDPCTGTWEKVLAGGLFVAGALLPGGGYSKIDDAARYADDAARRLDDVARRAPCGCFSEDTEVQTAAGPAKIQDIKVGDRLVSRDERDGSAGISEVQQLHVYHGRELFALVTERDDGARTELTLTDDHPIWAFDRGWTKSRDLRVGDFVSDVAGGKHRVIEFKPLGTKGKTFNFTVSNDSSYAVGGAGLWVHNGDPCDIKTYQTYTKTNPQTGDVYSGRTSGTGTPEENIATRDRSHHMNDQGYGPAVLDQSSTNKDAIRGREQQLIDHHGGAQSQGGTSGNAINGVSPTNPRRQDYLDAATKEFGGQ